MISEIRELERELELIDIVSSDRADFIGVGGFDWNKLFKIIRDNEAILSFSLGEKESYLFVITKDSIDVDIIPPVANLTELVDRYLGVLGSMNELSNVSEEVFSRCSREVFDRLMGGAYKDFREKRKLVIIADGTLHNLPFATLTSPDGLLVDRHTISYCPSLRSLMFLRERAEERARARKRPSIEIAAFGCIGIRGKGDFEKHGRLFAYTSVPVLPLYQAEREVHVIGKMFENSVICTGEKATERGFKAFPFEKTAILHLASHCYIDNNDVRRSFIVMNENGDGGEEGSGEVDGDNGFVEDGIVQWNEILALNMEAKLVTISGCRSAQGVISSGEGVRGLSQAFLYSGANCVLASLLDVPDLETSRFMEYFYREVKKGISFDESLRLAQLRAINSGGSLSLPSVWGAFSLIDSANSRAYEFESKEGAGWSGMQIAVVSLLALFVALMIFKVLRR